MNDLFALLFCGQDRFVANLFNIQNIFRGKRAILWLNVQPNEHILHEMFCILNICAYLSARKNKYIGINGAPII